jgi:hypothetical protein
LADQMEFLIGRIPKHSRIFPLQWNYQVYSLD